MLNFSQKQILNLEPQNSALRTKSPLIIDF